MSILNLKHSAHPIRAGLAILFALGALSGASAILHEDIIAHGQNTIDLIYRENFNEAFQEARTIIKKYPDHPAGYFFYAAAIDSWSTIYQSSRKEGEFYRYCEMAVDKGHTHIQKHGHSAWIQFFIGGAEGLKGNYETRYERWITAFRNGWKGVSILKDVYEKNPDMHDALYGIGTYEYWRSAMAQKVMWMPGGKDSRVEGIKKLIRALSDGTFTKISSAANLVDIYFNEKKYQKMLEISQLMLKQYPDSRLFLLGKAKALAKLKKYAEAQIIFNNLLQKAVQDNPNNHYNEYVYHYWLAEISLASQNKQKCRQHKMAARAIQLSEEIEKRLKDTRKSLSACSCD